ncbi:DNA polymerase III subunit beta [Mycoplasmopsis californica]|nr:DNA polymerase III subunit beta [Mycoplasmopsis californica]
MKFHINKKIFDEALEIVSKYIDSNNAYLNFRCVLVDVDNEFITLRAANDSSSIIKKLPVDDEKIKIEKTGKFLVQSNILKSIIKKLNNVITFDKSINGILEISQGNSRYQLSTLDEKTYPAFDILANTKNFEINTNEFKKAIKNVIHSTSEDNSLIYRCINLRYKDNAIIFTATDSFRLSLYKMPINSFVENEFDISIDAKDLKDLIPADAPKNITLFYNDLKVGVKYTNTSIVSRIVTLPFKDTEPVFNTIKVKNTIQIEKSILNEMLNKIWMTNGDKKNRIQISVNSNELKLINNVSEVGSFVDSTKNFKFEGTPFEMDLNYIFFKDAISVLENEVSILISDDLKKILILCSSNKYSKQLITPLRR